MTWMLSISNSRLDPRFFTDISNDRSLGDSAVVQIGRTTPPPAPVIKGEGVRLRVAPHIAGQRDELGRILADPQQRITFESFDTFRPKTVDVVGGQTTDDLLDARPRW
jgi:hypothetical protein